MARIVPKNWAEFQHYKDRSPDWIKLHRRLLDDFEFQSLPVESRALAPMLWLLASDSVDGTIDADERKLSFRLRMSVDEIRPALAALLDAGFFEPCDGDGVPASPAAMREKNGFGSRHISDEIKRAVWARDEGMCKQCGSLENIEYDHIIPVSKGGQSQIENLQLLCRPCNRSKRTKTVEQLVTPAQPPRSLEERTSKVEGRKELPVGTGVSDPKPLPKAKTDYTPEFQKFWDEYPTDANMPKKPAFKQWQRLTPEKQAAALAAIPGFKSYCDKNKSWYRPIYAERFLSQEKFEGYSAGPKLTPEQIDANKDRADKLFRRGKYAENYQ